MPIATLSIDLVAKLANIERDLGKAATVAERNAKRMEDAYSGASSVIRSAFAGLASAISVGAVAKLVQSSLDAADSLSKLSQRTGETVENLAKLQYAGSLADVSNEALAGGLQKLSKSMSAAVGGTGEAADAFKAIGVSVVDSSGKLRSSGDVLNDIADRFSTYKDSAAKAALAQAIFGRSGAELIPLLNAGARGLKEMGDEARRLGIVISTETAQAAERFNDNMTRLRTSIAGASHALVNPLIPSLDNTAKRMQELTEQGHGVLAVFRGIAGLAKIPFDLAIGDVDLSYSKQVADLEATLEGLEQKHRRSVQEDGGLLSKLVLGSQTGQIEKQIAITKNQLDALKKYGDRLNSRNFLAGGEDSNERFISGRGRSDAPIPNEPKEKTGGGRVAKAIDDGRRLVDQLRDQVRATQELTEVEKLELAISDGKYRTATAGNLEIARGYAETLDAIKANAVAADLESDAIRKTLSLYEEGARVMESVRTPMEALDTEVARLVGLLDAGAITMDTFGRAASQAGQGFIDIMDKVKATDDVLNEFAKSGAGNIQSAFANFLFDPFENGLAGMAQSFGNTVKRMIAEAVAADFGKRLFGDLSKGGLGTGWLGDLGKVFANADGGVYSSASLSQYSGQVVSRPTLFAFARGAGVMGEAGPEAILPLERGASGKLGVRASGGGITLNNYFTLNGVANEADARRAAGQISRGILGSLAAAQRYK